MRALCACVVMVSLPHSPSTFPELSGPLARRKGFNWEAKDDDKNNDDKDKNDKDKDDKDKD